jgi:hypothetical protein
MPKHIFYSGDPCINKNGRPKGSKNKATIAKEMILQILQERLPEARKMDFKDFFPNACKILPRETKLDLSTEEPLQLEITVRKPDEKAEG